MTKKPWECCNYPTFAVKKEILAACQQKCWQIEETEALQCCIRKCVLRDTGTLEDLKFNGENFQDCLKENHYKEVMSEAWKSVARKSTEKCVIESKIKLILKIMILDKTFHSDPASDKMDARGCSLSFVDNIVTCCIVDMFFNCPYYHASSECGETKKIFENCVKEGKGDLVFHILASKPQ